MTLSELCYSSGVAKQHSLPKAHLWGKLQPVALQMRREPTPAEECLWQLLRGRQLSGYKFRRQRPIDRFIVDFTCPKAALIIEVDGDVHKKQVEADLERDLILSSLGYRVLRFTNNEVLEHPDQVLQQILSALAEAKRT